MRDVAGALPQGPAFGREADDDAAFVVFGAVAGQPAGGFHAPQQRRQRAGVEVEALAQLIDTEAIAQGQVHGLAWLGSSPAQMPLFTWMITLHALIFGTLAPLTYVLMQGAFDAARSLFNQVTCAPPPLHETNLQLLFNTTICQLPMSQL